jgi:hypothetical protein
MTDWTGGPEREWYDELEEEWIDPDIIRGIERVTGETYEDGTWHSNPSVS